MRIYLVYDTKDNEIFVMRGTAKRIGRELDVPSRNVRYYAKNGYLIKRRYRVVIDNEQ